MCGIFGAIDKFPKEESFLIDVLNLQEHRGPDQYNFYNKGNIFVGHRRLSILDLSENGIQPMFNSNKSILITVNGEIYNYLDLKRRLSKKFKFNSTSDSEVLLNYYIEFGIDRLSKDLDGMFAVAIVDYNINKTFLIRDRVGIKPLYYSVKDGLNLVWSSELKSITAYFGMNLELDYTALYDFLTYLYIPFPKTSYKNVFKLEPGHYVEFDMDKYQMKNIQYWDVNLDSCYLNENVNTLKEKLRETIINSCKAQLVSDVPVGFFLSGGIDSSIISIVAASLLRDPISTFTISFDDPKYDESIYAREISSLVQSKHFSKNIKDIDVDFSNSQILKWFDEPFADTSCFPTYQVSKFASNEVKVILGGDGGDELFFGYGWYLKFLNYLNHKKFQFRYLINIEKKIKNKFLKYLFTRFDNHYLTELEKYTRLMGGMLNHEKVKYKKQWNIPENYDDYWFFRKFYREDLPIVKRLQYLDFKTYLPEDILTKVDRTSMVNSLECRVPFLSNDIIDYAFNIPSDYLFNKKELKSLLKEAFNNELPISVLNRRKKGFSIPWNELSNNKVYFKQEAVLIEFIYGKE